MSIRAMSLHPKPISSAVRMIGTRSGARSMSRQHTVSQAMGSTPADEPAQRPGRTVDGAVALHGHDTVDNRHGRTKVTKDVDEEGAELGLDATFLEMPEGLALARDTAVHVLDGEGHGQLLMGFELGQVDDGVGLQCDRAEIYAGLAPTKTLFARLVQIDQRDTERFQGFDQSQLCGTGPGVGPGGRVAHDGFGAVVFSAAGRYRG